MKIELELNIDQYIKLSNELKELHSKYEELNMEYEELECIINILESELVDINTNIEKYNKEISKLMKNIAFNLKTISVITLDGTIITFLVFAGLGVNYKEPMFALYGTLFYIGEIMATNKIIQRLETKRMNRVVNSKEYFQINKEIELLKILYKEKEAELENKRMKSAEKKEELNSINEEIENKNNEIELIATKAYMEVDNILESSIKDSKSKKRVKTIDENK